MRVGNAARRSRHLPLTSAGAHVSPRRDDARRSLEQTRRAGRPPACKHARVKLTVIGCSPAWPNPGGTQSGYLVEGSGSVLLDCGPGVLSRLRLGGGWPEPGAIALTHFHLDHCGDLIPWVWGAFYERDATDRRRRPDLWVPPGGRDRLASIGTEFGFREMFEQVFSIEEYEPGRPFLAGGQCGDRAPGPPLPHGRLRLPRQRRRHDDRLLR